MHFVYPKSQYTAIFIGGFNNNNIIEVIIIIIILLAKLLIAVVNYPYWLSLCIGAQYAVEHPCV
jgi:hypothetical protein